MKLIILSVCLLLIGNAHAESPDITLGYLLDLSAKGAFIGQQSRAGAELARQELAKTGITVKIIYEDHRTDAKLGVSGAQKLINADRVEAVMCDLTPPCVAASPVVAAAKKLFIYQAPITSILEKNAFAFKNFLDYEEGCRLLAGALKERGVRHVAHFKVNTEFGELCLKGSRTSFPAQELFEYDSGNDLRTFVTKLKQIKIDAIFQTGYESDYIGRIRASDELKLTAPTAMPQPLLTETVAKSVSSEALRGTIAFGFPAVSEDFISRLKAAGLYYSAVSIESAAISYLHVKQLAAAIASCKEKDVDCLRLSFANSGSNTTLGFRGWKDRIASYDYRIRSWKNGHFEESAMLGNKNSK